MSTGCCCNQYLGLFCKDSGGAVAGYSCFKDGVPVVKYYDINTGLEYFGGVSPNCSGSNVRVNKVEVTGSPMVTYTDSLFEQIRTDPVSGLKMIWVTVDTGSGCFVYIQSGTGSSTTFEFISADTIEFGAALSIGSFVEFKFFY